MEMPHAIPVRFQNANPILVTLGDDVGREGMPTHLDEIQVFSPLPQFPRGFRSSAAPWHPKGQGEQSDPIDTVLFNHPLDSRDEPVAAFLAVRGERFRLVFLLFNAAIAIMTRKG